MEVTPSFMHEVERDAEVLLANTGFSEALIRFCEGLPSLYAGDWAASRAIVETRRWAVALFITYQQGLPGAEPPTRALLDRVLVRSGLTGRHGLRGALAVLIGRGFVVEQAHSDRRARLLSPTPKLTDLYAASLALRLRALGVVRPLPDEPERMATVPGAAHAMLAATAEPFMATGFQLHQDYPEVKPFTERLLGYFVLHALLAQAERNATGDPIRASPVLLARELSVSRSHVEKVLAGAVAARVLVPVARGAWRFTPEAHDRLRRWIATELAWTARHQRIPVR